MHGSQAPFLTSFTKNPSSYKSFLCLKVQFTIPEIDFSFYSTSVKVIVATLKIFWCLFQYSVYINLEITEGQYANEELWYGCVYNTENSYRNVREIHISTHTLKSWNSKFHMTVDHNKEQKKKKKKEIIK